MEATDLRQRDDSGELGSLHSPGLGGVALEGQVRSVSDGRKSERAAPKRLLSRFNMAREN
jgi:hypothetical protein